MTQTTTLPHSTALVTGASRGIGAAICRRLTGLGLTVYGLGRDAAALGRLAQDCGVVPITADVRDTAALEKMLAGIAIDVLVNNAGLVTSVEPLHQQSAQDIADMVTVNLTAPLLLMRLLLPRMIGRQLGHIVNITSTAGHNVFAGTAAYGGSKAGLSQAGRVMRYDLAGSRVRLTEIAPGRVETDVYLQAFRGDRDRLRDAMYTKVRAIQPDDIAKAVEAAIRMPLHVDVSMMEIVPTDQATGGHIYREVGG